MLDVARILTQMVAYRRRERLPLEQILAVQRRRFVSLVGHVQRHSPYYRRRLAGLDPERVALQDLPVMEKAELMERWDEMACHPGLRRADVERHLADPALDGQKWRGHVVVRTSGTGGPSAIVLYDPAAFLEVKAISLARAIPVVIAPWRLGTAMAGDRLRTAAILAGTGFQPARANFGHLPRAARLFFDLRLYSLQESIPAVVQALQEFQPHLLIGYPSLLEVLAGWQEAGRMRILADQKETHVVSVSEPLEPALRARLKSTFQAPVRDLYGAGECLPLARSCPAERGLHVNADAVICEVVDDRNQPVPPGVRGDRILVTSLFNRGFPILRYALHDMAAWDPEPCPCGSNLPRLASVQGRSDQVLEVGGARVHPYLFLEPLRRVPGLLDFQVVQDAPDGLEVRCVGAADPARVEAVVRDVLAGAGAGTPWIRVVAVPRLEPDPVSHKVKRFWCRLDGEAPG